MGAECSVGLEYLAWCRAMADVQGRGVTRSDRDRIALCPDCKVVNAAFVVVCGFADQMNHKGQGVLRA